MSVRATWPGEGVGIIPLEQVDGTRFGSSLVELPHNSFFSCQVGREEVNPQNFSCWRESKFLRTGSRGLWKQHS